MCSSWLTTCRAFEVQIQSPVFLRAFRQLQKVYEPLGEFVTPQDLVSFVRSQIPSPGQRDAVLYALLDAFRSGGSGAKTAGPLLLLSMAPRLACVRRKTLRSSDSEDECVGEVLLCFFERVARWDPANHSVIALNLQLSTLRAVLHRRDQGRGENRRALMALRLAFEWTEFKNQDDVSVQHFWQHMAPLSKGYEPDDPELSDVRALLRDEVGLSAEEVELLVLRGPCRVPWDAVATLLGQNFETLRKRFRSLRERLRQNPLLQELCPDFLTDPRLSEVKGSRGSSSKRRTK